MRECPKCRQGHLDDQVIEAWMQRGTEWILIQRVPALVCDECGFEVFNQETAEALTVFTSVDGEARQIGTRMFRVYDFTNPVSEEPEVIVNSSEIPAALRLMLAGQSSDRGHVQSF